MLSRIENYLSKAIRTIKRLAGVKTAYKYGQFSIRLPASHMLPIYRRNHPKYDRFLPHLAKYIGSNEAIIDVGANCGDTLAGMVEYNPASKYICIEPDDGFYSDLVSNIARIKKDIPGLDVSIERYLVGKSVTSASLEGGGGTKRAVPGAGSKSSKPLDDILENISPPPVKLLKTDVDGFDYDVINSAAGLLTTQQPLVFFECEYSFEFQKDGYIRTINWLNSIGYVDWTIFDNFGEQILRTSDPRAIFQLIEYVWKQNNKITTRTIYYYDILAATSADKELVDKVLSTY